MNEIFSPKKIAVALSGGVDSSATAFLLHQEGHEVIGITALMHNNQGAHLAVQRASEVAKAIGIKHEVVDLRKEFNDKVITYFEESYKTGFTPNPCAVCNKLIKWGDLRTYTKEVLNAEYFATGHYARIINENGLYKLVKAGDVRKDQIYMLFSLSQDELAHTIFKLSDYTKPEVREIARKNGLPCAETAESQDFCFIQPPDTTSNYLTRKFGAKKGNIIDIETNKILGEHNGFYNYTFGQRKGIGVSSSSPLYVILNDSKTNSVYVGSREHTYTKELEIKNINWQQEAYSDKKEFKALVKIRYNTEAKEALIVLEDRNSATIKLSEPEFSITSGQVAVFYDLRDESLIGGGWIEKNLDLAKMESQK